MEKQMNQLNYRSVSPGFRRKIDIAPNKNLSDHTVVLTLRGEFQHGEVMSWDCDLENQSFERIFPTRKPETSLFPLGLEGRVCAK